MNWNEYFFELVELASRKSKDPYTPMGAIVVGPDREIRATGFNGFPRGVNDAVGSRYARPDKYLWTEHAERNAIYNAARVGVSLKGCSIYLMYLPCADCARAIIQAGIIAIYISKKTCPKQEDHFSELLDSRVPWIESMEIGKEMMKEAGVKVEII